MNDSSNLEDGFEYSREDQDFRRAITNELGSERLKILRAIEQRRTVLDLTLLYLFFLSAIYCCLQVDSQLSLRTISWVMLGAAIAGVGFNWLNVQVHEGSHFLLARKKQVNDLIANYLVGSIGFQSVEEYRTSHYIHHGHLNDDLDPDKYFYQEKMTSKKQFIKFLLRILFGAAVRQKITKGAWIPGSEDSAKLSKWMFPKLVGLFFHLGVASIILFTTSFLNSAAYFLVMFIGLMSIFPVLLAIRTWVQHKDPGTDYSIATARTMRTNKFVSRTTVANLLERTLIGARMDYHFEHHLFSRIPHYNLKVLHKELVARDFFKFQDIESLVTSNFVGASLRISEISKNVE